MTNICAGGPDGTQQKSAIPKFRKPRSLCFVLPTLKLPCSRLCDNDISLFKHFYAVQNESVRDGRIQ